MKLRMIDREEFHRAYGRLDTRRAICGFTRPDDTNIILTLLANRRPQRVLEIGTAAGHMTANFSEWSPDNAVVFSLGTVVGIPAGTANQAYENPDRTHFGAEADHFGKARKIQLVTADSLTYDFHRLAPLDFVFLDGAHDFEHVLSDTLKVYRELAPGGCLVWHDFNSPVAWVEVRKALDQTDFPEPIYHVAETEVAFLFKADGKSEAHRALAAVSPGIHRPELKSHESVPLNNDGLALARRHHQAGQLAEAETLYEQLLRAGPNQPEVWCLLADVRQRRGKLPEAVAAYQNASRLRPDHLAPRLGLADVLKEQGKADEALAAYRQALELDPNHVDALANLGVLLAEKGRIDEAIAHWQKALRVQPDCAKAVHNLGVALAQKGDHAEAIRCLERALALKPDYAEACFNLGNVLVSMNRREEAVDRFQMALRLRPDYADAYVNLGSVLTELHRPAEGVLYLRQAIRLRPSFAAAHNQLGLALAAQGQYAEAEASYGKALDLNPRYPEAHSNLGNAYQEQGRLAEALACYELALCHDPGAASTHWNRALSLLQKGDFEAGWAEYEWRWQRKQTPARPFQQPRWDGSPLEGRTILLYMEQGLGDMLMFIRYAALVKERGGTVIVECPAFLIPLFSRCMGIDRLVAEGTPLPEFDVQAPLMSLPSLLGTTLATVPAKVPYFNPDDQLVEQWRQRLGVVDGFKIGIVWQGNPHHSLDHYRSIALNEFAPLAAVPGVRLVSLQCGSGREQLSLISSRFSVIGLGADLDKEAGAFMDTAAIMKCLDLVVIVDTAAAHLAGGLGVPVWVPLCAIGEWRWLLDREDSPWYPTMRLFRQKKLGEWGPTFQRMAREVESLVSTASDCSFCVPLSPGELLDKITILEIKSQRMTDPEKLRHVRDELDLLNRVREQRIVKSEQLHSLVVQLIGHGV